MASHSPEEVVTKTRYLLGAKTKAERRELLDKYSVDVLEFVLYLFTQTYSKFGMRSPKANPTECWPEREGGAAFTLSPTRLQTIQGKANEEAAIQQFFRKHIWDLLYLLSGTARVKAGAHSAGIIESNSSRPSLSVDQLDRLGLILAGGSSYAASALSLSAVYGNFTAGGMAPVKEVGDWISALLTPNLHAYPNLPRQLGAVLVPSPGQGHNSPHGTANAAMDESMDMFESVPVRQPITLYGLHKRTLVLTAEDVTNRVVRIIGCQGVTVYVLGPCRDVLMLSCVGCTLFVGAVSQFVHVDHSEKLTCMISAVRLKISNTSQSNFYLCVNSSPLLHGNVHRIGLAPLNAYYGGMEQHMMEAGVNPLLNLWKEPVVLAPLTGSPQKLSPGALHPDESYHIIQPSHFLPFSVPFKTAGPTVAIPSELPVEYEEALQQRVERVHHLRKRMQEECADENVRKDMQQLVEARFKEWLNTSGNIREVQDLLKMSERT